MRPLFLTKYTAVTAVGRGLAAHLEALRQRCSGLRRTTFEMPDVEMCMGMVDGLEDLVLPEIWQRFDCRNNRLAWLGLQQDGFLDAVCATVERYGAARVAVILGTSTSGILETERAYRRRDPETGELPQNFLGRYRYTHNTFSVGHFVRSVLQLRGPAAVVSTACSSSAKVFACAARWIAAGLCDAAVVGGVDSLCLTTLCGFASLDLISPLPCRPCDANRDGLNIGEAAAFILLEKSLCNAQQEPVALLGYGESCDAYHMSHPHPAGWGAIAAMEAALWSANLQKQDIDYVQLHGTATKANDRIEDRAVCTVIGSGTPCSSTKGWTGHTLGAAGAVGSIFAALCLTHGFLPGTLNTVKVDPELSGHILLRNHDDTRVSRVLSNYFGFGGNNCSLILGQA